MGKSGSLCLCDSVARTAIPCYSESMSSTSATAVRLRELLELLETCAANRRLLDELAPAERERLHRALAEIANPDPVSRRLQVKAWTRARKAERARKDDTVL